MAESHVEVTVHGSGFEQLAGQADKAGAAIKQMGAAVRGANAAGAGTKQLADDMRRVTNGVNIGGQIGKDIQKGLSKELSNGGFWNNVFTGLNSRFKTAGQNFAKSFNAGVQAATQNLRNMNGGNGPSHTQLLGGAAAGYGAFEFLRSVGEAASRREQARLNLAGLGKMTTKDQRATLERFADQASASYGNISGTEGLNFLSSMLQIQGHSDELFDNGGPNLSVGGSKALNRIFGLMSFMKTFEGGKHAGDTSSVIHEFEAAIRSSELAGRLKPEEMADWITNSVKTSIAYGVTPDQMLAAQRAGGTAFLGLNEHGRAAFSAFVQENKQRAGVQLMSFVSRMVGGTGQSWMSNEALRDLGLIDDNDIKNHPEAFQLSHDGKISRVLDTKMYKNGTEITQDPYHWLTDVFYPALRNKVKTKDGIDLGDITKPLSGRTEAEKDAMIRETGMTFGNRSNAIIALETLIQAANIEKRAGVFNDVDLNPKDRSDSFLHQTQAFSDQMDQLKTKLGEGILPALNDYLKDINSGISGFSTAAENHPVLGTIAKYSAEALIGASVVSAGKLFYNYVLSFPLRLLGSVGWLGAGLIGGIYGGGKGLFGDLPKLLGIGGAAGISGEAALEAGAVAATTSRLSKWLAPLSKLGGLLSVVRRIFSIAMGVGTAYKLGQWAVDNTDTGAAMWKAVTADWKRWLHGGKATNAEKQLARDAAWRSNNILRSDFGMGPSGPAPSYLDILLGSDPANGVVSQRQKYWDMAHKRGPYGGDWINHIQPYHAPQTWVPQVFGRGGAAFSGSGRSTPMPVVVTQMPKQAAVATTLQVNVGGVTVQLPGTSLGAVKGAVGSAVGSKVSNALSDQHH